MKISLCLRGAVISCVFSTLAGVGCSAIRDMDNMKDTTQSLSDKTDQLNTTTQDLDKETKEVGTLTVDLDQTTHQVKDLTNDVDQKTAQVEGLTNDLDLKTADMKVLEAHLDQIASQGNSAEVRRDKWIDLKSATSIEDKISEAVIYEEAFEFQIHSLPVVDSKPYGASLYKDAIAEFFRATKEFVPADHKIDVASTDPKTMNILALSVAMGEINSIQQTDANTYGFKAQSILTLIKSGLKMKAKVDSGEITDEPDYVDAVMKEEPTALYMLRLRLNMLAAMPIPFLSDYGLTAEYLFGWAPDFSKVNSKQLEDYNVWLKESNETRDFLKSIGQDPQVDGHLKSLWQKANVKLPAAKSSPMHKLNEVKELNDKIGVFNKG